MSAPGTLYVVATPLGNLEDVSLRALRVLKEVAAIACEDTRRTSKLLARYEIRNSLVAYHEHNKDRSGTRLLERIQEGESIALVSDAGTPGISDPGYEIVRDAVAKGVAVEVVPGPSALIAALVLSGLPTDRFAFEGFLPSRQERRRKALAALASEPRTLVFYESPQRLADFLTDAISAFGAERRACVVRELTKVHEEVRRGTLCEMSADFGARPEILGEICVVVAGAPKAITVTVADALDEAMDDPELAALSSKDLARTVADRNGLRKSDVYEEILKRK